MQTILRLILLLLCGAAQAQVIVVAPPVEEPVNNAPTWTGTPNPTFTEGVAGEYDLCQLATDQDDDPLTCALATCSAPTGITDEDGVLTATTGTSAGTTTSCTATADDGTASPVSSSSFSITVAAAATDVEHGDLHTINGSGFGTKADNNSLNLSFQGSEHLAKRASDLEDANATLSPTNTLAGWQIFTGGFYPHDGGGEAYLGNTDAVTYGLLVDQTGGPGPSGRYLRRNVLSSRLPNWNMVNENITADYVYVSFHLTLSDDYDGGKWWRQYFQNSVSGSTNFFLAGANSITGDNEGGGGETMWGSSPSALPQALESWVRVEMHQDYDNDTLTLYLNNQLVTSSYDYEPWLNSGGNPREIKHLMLANTPAIGQELGYALLYADNSDLRVELADSCTWASRTKSIWQAPITWADTAIQIRVNQGDHASMANKCLHVMQGQTSIHQEAINSE